MYNLDFAVLLLDFCEAHSYLTGVIATPARYSRDMQWVASVSTIPKNWEIIDTEEFVSVTPTLVTANIDYLFLSTSAKGYIYMIVYKINGGLRNDRNFADAISNIFDFVKRNDWCWFSFHLNELRACVVLQLSGNRSNCVNEWGLSSLRHRCVTWLQWIYTFDKASMIYQL